MMESGYYAPGTERDPRAPWNETDTEDAGEVIEDMDGKDFFESSNWDIEGSLDCFNGRVAFDVPNLYGKRWSELSTDEQELFEQYATVVRGFAHLYEKGMARD